LDLRKRKNKLIMVFIRKWLWIFVIGIMLSCNSSPDENKAETASDLISKEKMEDNRDTGPMDDQTRKVILGDVSFSLSTSWSEETSTDSARGYKYSPCSETYCNNLFVSMAEIGPGFEYLDWSNLVSAYVKDLGKSSLLKISLLQDSFENSQDSTWYELRYSYENERGDVFISELHMIWLPSAHLYVFDFTAIDSPSGAFANFKVKAISDVIKSINY
tara:strand:+ start:397 stop:1047 length:651 start_codon:yes stop_codon:yes gene_type:complete